MKFIKDINENFGALNFQSAANRRLSPINQVHHNRVTPTGGVNRIPQHWGNTRFISGAGYGSGYGHFGRNPKSKDKVMDFDDFLQTAKKAHFD